MRRLAVYFFIGLAFTFCHAKKELQIGDETAVEMQLRSKYATQLEVETSAIQNIALYTFIDDWIGVKYAYGGNTKKGTDCSGFMSVLYDSIYHQKLPRRSADIAAICSTFKQDKLVEGDFVFFKISGNKVSHVGVYLINNYFVHASTSRGVIISNLNEPYYTKNFWKGGRLKTEE